MVAMYIRHIRTITKGSQFQNFSTFTCVNMMTSTATGAGGMWDLKPSEGNVFVRGKPICDDGWGQNEADVACRFVFNILRSQICLQTFNGILLGSQQTPQSTVVVIFNFSPDLLVLVEEDRQSNRDTETLLEEASEWTMSNVR